MLLNWRPSSYLLWPAQRVFWLFKIEVVVCCCFLTCVCRFISRPVTLVKDNCGPHGTDLNNPQKQVIIYTFPPNFTSILQPSDLGIIRAWRLLYRWLLLQEIVKHLELRQEKKYGSSALLSGMRELAKWHEPHLSDVVRLCVYSLFFVMKMTVFGFWVKSASCQLAWAPIWMWLLEGWVICRQMKKLSISRKCLGRSGLVWSVEILYTRIIVRMCATIKWSVDHLSKRTRNYSLQWWGAV